MPTQKNFSQKIESIPTSTGVYKFLDKDGTILYVGKAINLRSRVRSYFSSNHLDRPWIRQMIPLISDIQVTETENEVEALIFEANLVKKHQPKYNADLKDDKRFAWILINTRKPFPKVERTRETDAKGRYFGPYPDGRPIKRVLKYLRRLYPYRSCNLQMHPDRKPEDVKKSRLCVYYHIGQCQGPCDNLITPEEYKESISNIIKLLQGKRKSQVKELEKKMYEFAEKEEFEQASALRDKIDDLKYLSQRIDIDYGDTEDEFRQIQETRFKAGIEEVVKILDLNIPEEQIKRTRIECYDISNISGQIAYGSMVVSVGTKLDTSLYRVFKIREATSTNDPEMLKEVIRRRLRYLEKLDTGGTATATISSPAYHKESLLQKPRIIVLDGAKPQLSTMRPVIPENITLIAISKGKHLKRAGKKQEDEFWTILSDGSFKKFRLENPFLFQRLRDEAHRFAIKHHRKGRKYNQKKSVLDEILGVGPKRKRDLMKKFGSVKELKKSSVEEINEIVKNKNVAKAIKDGLST